MTAEACPASLLDWSAAADSWHLLGIGLLAAGALIAFSLLAASFWHNTILGQRSDRHETYDNGVSSLFLFRFLGSGPTFQNLTKMTARTTRRRLYSGTRRGFFGYGREIWTAGHPALVKHVFSSPRLWHKITKPEMNSLAFMSDVPNNAMLYTGDSPEWKHARSAWSPFFLQTDFNTFDEKIDEIVEKHLVRLMKYRDGKAELLELMLYVTVDLLCQTLYGALLPQDELNVLVECLAEFTVPSTAYRGKYPGNLGCYDYHRKVARDISEKAPDGVFVRVIMGDEQMAEPTRHDNCAFFLEALTPAFASFWSICNIILKNTVDKTSKEQALSDPVFREKCIKESLRMYPPVPTLWGRIANKTHTFANPLFDDTIKDDRGLLGKIFSKPDIRTLESITIKKDTCVFVIPGPLHYDDRVWQNPEEFFPERWDKDPTIIKPSTLIRKKRQTTWGALALKKGAHGDMRELLKNQEHSMRAPKPSGYDTEDVPLRYKLFGAKVENDIKKENLEHLKAAADNESYLEWSFFPFGLGKHQCLGRRLAVKMVDGIVGNLLMYDINFATGNTPNLFKRHWTDRLNSVSAVYNYPADPVFVEFGEVLGDIVKADAAGTKGRRKRSTTFVHGGKSIRQLPVFDELDFEDDKEKCAVLFISCQNEFLEPEGKLYDKVKDVMSRLGTKKHLKELMDTAIDKQALIIHAPVAIEESYQKEGFDEWGLSTMKGVFTPGSWGTELYEDTASSSDDIILAHRTKSDVVTGTGLLRTLKDNQIEKLFIAGLLSDVTVEKTVEQLSKALKGRITLHPVSDATAAFSMEAQTATFKFALAKRSKPVTTDEAVFMLGGED